MWSVIIPILTFLVGLAVGGFVVYKVIMKKMSEMKMPNDPKQIQALAQTLGMKLNQKQLNMVTNKLQKQQKPTTKPTKSKKKK